jgi:hypothetical protein
MPDPANLTKAAFDQQEPQAVAAKVLDSAEDPGEEVRCMLVGDDLGATDPMPWDAVARPAGLFYPKRGDRAVVVFPEGGTPYIDFFRPTATEPDHAF